jgi:hypothetical protein
MPRGLNRPDAMPKTALAVMEYRHSVYELLISDGSGECAAHSNSSSLQTGVFNDQISRGRSLECSGS